MKCYQKQCNTKSVITIYVKKENDNIPIRLKVCQKHRNAINKQINN